MQTFMGWDANTWQQVIGVCLFLGVVLTIGLWSAAIVIGIVADKLSKKPYQKLKRHQKLILTFGVMGLLCILYGAFVEPFWPEFTFLKLSSSKLAPHCKVRIIHISDVHSDPFPRLEERLPAEIAALKPDIIAFSGDALNCGEGLPIYRKFLTRLAKIAPTFVVKGNWDAWYFTDLDRFGGTGATELDGTAQKVAVGDCAVWVGGLPVGTQKAVKDAMQNAPVTDYRVFLFHYPDFIEEMEKNKIDLYLAGHTHGGQIALPFYGAIVTLSARGKQFESGLHNFKDTYLYVNRGIGMEGGKAPRVRFCARPEITVIDVTASTANR